MQTNRIIKMFLLILALFVLQNQVIAQPTQQEIRSLSGFDTLKVTVEILDPNLTQAGLTLEQIKTDIELNDSALEVQRFENGLKVQT